MMKNMLSTILLSSALLLCAGCGSSIKDARNFVSNKPPVVTFDVVYAGSDASYSKEKLAPGIIYNVIITANDPEGGELSYTLTPVHGTVGTLVKKADGAATVFVVGSIKENDPVTLTLTVRDPKNALFTQQVDIGTGKKLPSLSVTAPDTRLAPTDATMLRFSSDCGGFYRVYCDNSISASDQAAISGTVEKYAEGAGTVDINILAPSYSGALAGVRLAEANAVNNVWLVFKDSLGQLNRQGFFIAVEGSNPTVTATAPADGAQKISLTPTISVNFSKDMNADTLNSTTVTMSTGAAAVAITDPVYATSTRSASFKPSASLSNDTVYTVTVSRTVTDNVGASGNRMLADCSFSFRTIPLGYLSVPECAPAPGTYTGAQSVTIASADGASIAYTLDGSTPAVSGTTITHGLLYSTPIDVSADMTITALAFATGSVASDPCAYSYKIRPAAPVFSLAAGTWTGTQTLTLTGTGRIYYTTDGSDPAAGSVFASSGTGISVDKSMTVRAVCRVTGLTDSEETAAAYKIRLLTPTASIAAGTYDTDQTVYLSAAAGATIWYTLDGTSPLNSATRIGYSGGIAVAGNGTTVTINAYAEKDGLEQSEATGEAVYRIDYGSVMPPVITIDNTTDVFGFTEVKVAVITCPTEGATIHYGTNGSTDEIVDQGFTVIVDKTMTLYTYATKSGKVASPHNDPTYTLTVPTPMVDRLSNVLTITCASGSTAYYTTNGDIPTESSTKYITPVHIPVTAVVKVKAFRAGWNPSGVYVSGRLVGEWLLNGNTNDTSGNAINGTGTVTYVADRKGNASSACLVSTGQTVILADGSGKHAALDFYETTPFSVSLWFKTDQLPGGVWWPLFRHTSEWHEFDYVIHMNQSKVLVEADYNSGQAYDVGASIVVDTWYHVVMVYSGSPDNRITGYLNGVSFGSKVFESITLGASATGVCTFGPSASALCIDNVRIYSRAISAAEVMALYKE